MNCAFCGQEAERACTRCGRFFCQVHGGDRLVGEGLGNSYRVVTRAVCDSCTPNQAFKQFAKGCQIAVAIIVVVMVIAAVVLVGHFFLKLW